MFPDIEDPKMILFLLGDIQQRVMEIFQDQEDLSLISLHQRREKKAILILTKKNKIPF
jgi:hypothetical protein